MNIFSKILGFFASLIPFFKSQYDKLPADQKADVQAAIQAGNVIKANVEKDAPAVLVFLEKELGTYATDKIAGILDKVASNIGLPPAFDVEETLQNILDHLRPKTGSNWEDTVFDIVKYIAINLTGGTLTRNIAIIIIQFVYDHVFVKATASVLVTETQAAATELITTPVPVPNMAIVTDPTPQQNAIDDQTTAPQNNAMPAATESPAPIPETPGFLEGSYTPPAKPVDPAAGDFLKAGGYIPPA